MSYTCRKCGGHDFRLRPGAIREDGTRGTKRNCRSCALAAQARWRAARTPVPVVTPSEPSDDDPAPLRYCGGGYGVSLVAVYMHPYDAWELE